MDLDLIWTICLESPDPLSSKALFSLCSLTTHFIFFDFFWWHIQNLFAIFHVLLILVVLFTLISVNGISVYCTAVPQGAMYALLVGYIGGITSKTDTGVELN